MGGFCSPKLHTDYIWSSRNVQYVDLLLITFSVKLYFSYTLFIPATYLQTIKAFLSHFLELILNQTFTSATPWWKFSTQEELCPLLMAEVHLQIFKLQFPFFGL